MAQYGIAHNLRGFEYPSLRVRVERIDGDNIWVRTADLSDAGTPLTLDISQVEMFTSHDAPIWRHKDGLVEFWA
jgi:hypothetical protein